MSAVRLTILGAGTLLPDRVRHSAAHHVAAGKVSLLLDCGAGTLHALDGTFGPRLDSLTHVAITHFHTDHWGDLESLFFAWRHSPGGGRSAPLTLLGPEGLRERLEALAAAHGDFVLDPGFPLDVVELAHGARWAEGSLTLSAHRTEHTPESLAFRVEVDGVSVGYTGDTGPCAGLGAFFARVEALVSECAVPDPPPVDNHLSPAGVAALAGEARPRVLVTTHAFPALPADEVPALVREAGYTGDVLAGVDGLALELEPGAWRPAPVD